MLCIFLDRNVSILYPCLSSEFKNNAKGKLVCYKATAVAAAPIRVKVASDSAVAAVCLWTGEPHTHATFDFLKRSAGASVCNAAVNSL